MNKHWYELVLRMPDQGAPDPDEMGGLLMQAGAAGVELKPSGELHAFVETCDAECSMFLAEAATLGFTLLSKSKVQEENWCARCTELWQAVRCGIFEVIPTTEVNSVAAQENRESEAASLRVVPGTGFGTGHHASTAMVLEFISDLFQQGFSPRSVHDLGTGSGILAIACARIWDCSVQAADIDDLALKNADLNIGLNNVAQKVRTLHGGIETLAGRCDLFLANIYAEILVELPDKIRKCLNQGAIVCLSGIAAAKCSIVEAAYPADRWVRKESSARDGWHSLMLVSN